MIGEVLVEKLYLWTIMRLTSMTNKVTYSVTGVGDHGNAFKIPFLFLETSIIKRFLTNQDFKD